MSALTPPSFIDDTPSFPPRPPHGLGPSYISTWLDSASTDSTSTSAYTGSFIDDGADMLLPPTRSDPGFGPIDARFYRQRKRNEEPEGMWNEAVQQAVSGDIHRHLAKIRELGDVDVRRRGGEHHGKRGRRETVIVHVPRKWGTFVIRGEDGRVIVVDRDGEFDSGVRGGGVGEKRREAGRWVRAASSVEEPILVREDSRRKEEKEGRMRREGKHGKKHRCKETQCKCVPAPPLKPLTTIPESEYEDGCVVSSGEDSFSSTGFFMTGGASGWPSREPTSVASPAGSESHVRSPPGGWPSPPLSPVKSTATSKSSNDDNLWGVDKELKADQYPSSHRSKKAHKPRRHETDNHSTKTYSTYKAPAVEDAPNTSLGSASSLHKAVWDGSTRDEDNWEESKNASKKGSEASWNSSKKSSANGWDAPSNAASNNSWDAFEKNKTASEVSVADSGSKRSVLSSLAPSHRSTIHRRHQSGRSRASNTVFGDQGGWDGSQVSKKTWSNEIVRVDDDGWGGETSKSGWNGSRRGAGSNVSAKWFRRA